MRLFIGLMSGTSMDGMDAALVDVDNHVLIAGLTSPYSLQAQQRLQAVLSADSHALGPATLSQLNTLLGREFARVVMELLEKTNLKPEQIVAIGSHGQTICHDATGDIPYSVQLGCAHTIAALTGIDVVADFRVRDMVNGGQGAPFAPIYHQTLWRNFSMPIAIVNVGGIANVTFLIPNGGVSGYDTGPGNCLMDAWTQSHLHMPYDKDGAWGATGHVLQPLLSAMLDDAYFAIPAPKSLDKAYFSQAWLARLLHANYTSQDVQATLVAFTAASISLAIHASDLSIKHLAICGGGVHNQSLLQQLRCQLPDVQVESTQFYGIDPDFLEAMIFAWLASQTLNKIPIDLTQITGAKNPALSGAIYLK